MASHDVVMLIDRENLAISLREEYEAVVNPLSLRKLARRSGRLVQTRAYADWRDAVWQQDLDVLAALGEQVVGLVADPRVHGYARTNPSCNEASAVHHGSED